MTLFKISFLILCSLLFISSALAEQHNKTNNLIIGIIDDEEPPYRFIRDGKQLGIQADLAMEVARRAEVNITIKPIPWKRILLLLEKGELDGTVVGYKTPERVAYAIYTDIPLQYVYFSIFVMKGLEFPYREIENLQGKRIGKQRGYYVSKEFNRAAKDKEITLYENNKLSSLITMLRINRVDAIIGLDSAVKYELFQKKMKNVVALPTPINQPRGAFLFFSKAANIAPEVVTRFNQALKEMKRENIFQKTFQKYGLDYLPPEVD